MPNRPQSKYYRTIASPIIGLATLSMLTAPASATWSILIADTRTGEFVVGSCTCLTGFDLAVETPVILTGYGAITAQSSVDQSGRNRMFVRDRLLENQPLDQILDELSTYDPGHDNRQYGMITTQGDTLTYSGISNANWAGGITGRLERGRLGPDDDIVYCVQGNILSGPNVVQDAVDAIVKSNTDLPGMLMESMQAAKVGGGDGRCSCSGADPTGCGSPPPEPFKSAHVGYMIGSRADDVDSIRAFYEVPGAMTSLTVLDHDSIATTTTENTIEIYTNGTHPNDQVAHLNHALSIDPNRTSLSKLVAADLDNNGLDDLVCLTGSSSVVICMQSAPNAFETPFVVNLIDSVTDITTFKVGDYAHDLLLMSHPNLGLNGQSIAYQLKDNTLDIVRTIDTQTTSIATIFEDIDPDDGVDNMFFVSPGANQIRTYRVTSDARFLRGDSINPSLDAKQVRLADVNNDSYPDLLVATGSSRMINCFLNQGPDEGFDFEPFPINSPIAAAAVDFQMTDLNNDGIQDAIVVLTSGPNLRYYLGDGNGNFVETDRTRLGGAAIDALLVDLNNDGDMDLVTNATSNLLIYDNLNNATVQRQTGFARGDKFMFFNIANAQASDPDPVDQMMDQFDAWRTTLEGKVDATQTLALYPRRIQRSQSTSIQIQLRDWRGDHLALADPGAWELVYNTDLLTISEPIMDSPGVFLFDVQTSDLVGADSIIIRVGDGEDRVRLMPDIAIEVVENLADYTNDGILDFFDLSVFIRAFSNQDPIADLTNDGSINLHDIAQFLSYFSGG